MISTAAIDHKWQTLQDAGFDLGEKVGLEQDAGLDGPTSSMITAGSTGKREIGAYEVHGPILDRYIELGGSGANPASGYRDLGFPTTDQVVSQDGPARSATSRAARSTW